MKFIFPTIVSLILSTFAFSQEKQKPEVDSSNLGEKKKKVEVEPVQLNFDFNKPKAQVQEPKPVAPQKPLEQVIKEASDRRLKIEQDAYDREYGKGGIPGILRPE